MCLQPRPIYPTASLISLPTQNVQDRIRVPVCISPKGTSANGTPSPKAAVLQPSLFSFSSSPHPIQLYPQVCLPLPPNYPMNPALGPTSTADSLFQAPPSLRTRQPSLLPLCFKCSQGSSPAISIITAASPPTASPALT